MKEPVPFHDLIEKLSAELLVDIPNCTIIGGYTSDLLSDVMVHAVEGDLLITIQAHTNTIAVASHVGIPAILFCNDRPIPEEVRLQAVEHEIAVARTADSEFIASAKLYQILH